MNDTPALSAETADRKHVPQLERQAENQRPKTHDHREAKLYRYAGTDLYQWFSKRGVSVFEEQASEPFVLRARSDHQPTGEVEELIGWLDLKIGRLGRLGGVASLSDINKANKYHRIREALRSLSGQVAEKDALWAKDMSLVIDQRNAAGAERDEARATIEHQAQELAKLRGALERLGSMEAFETSRPIDKVRDAELLARIDYARSALNEVKSNG